ncbi:GGDEF domain-containing protein [Sphaerochaeta pleomorpha]|uniref:GGDEF domain-containing protein n=1 Tax=Sphaerochaeta pleomorpha TaxID=1131707 RepID=UPI00155A7A84|nr:GGDEF domain-containing protein [Sphaerochaeta pleomorpha]
MAKEIQNHASAIAILTAHIIDQDMDSYRKLSETEEYTEGNYDLAYYEAMNQLFRQLKNELGVDYIYTEKRTGNDSIAYLLDGEEPLSENFSPIGAEDYLADFERNAYDNKKQVSTDLVQSSGWGKFISAYAPIIDKRDGSLVGLAGVDFSAETFLHFTKKMAWIIFSSFTFLSIFLTTTAYYLIAKRFESLKIDYLTKLNSKQYFEKQINEEIRESRVKKSQFSLLMIDIDRFKLINDSYGHMVGDLVLKAVATTLQQGTRRSDVCSRIGGDEFTVILKDITSVNDAVSVAQTIQGKLINYPILDDKDLHFTISIGIAQWVPGLEASDIMKQADIALYKAKEQGKNCVVCFTEFA